MHRSLGLQTEKVYVNIAAAASAAIFYKGWLQMNINDFIKNEGEKPLDRLPENGGFCGIFRTIGCIGDSLSSGEFEGVDENGQKTYHDLYDYSWGQYIARMIGSKVYNFSRGGMTAEEYLNSFAEQNNFFAKEYACQAYIIALGVNDIYNKRQPVGDVKDIDPVCFKNNNRTTFAGLYGEIISKYREISPDAKFFLVTMPRDGRNEEQVLLGDSHAELLYKIAGVFENTYVIDLRKYGPEYDDDFKSRFYLGGHMNPCGYMLTARMIAGYIDFIIRENFEDFKQAGFIGTPFKFREIS